MAKLNTFARVIGPDNYRVRLIPEQSTLID
jgi:hypothetical protein